jgi:hypothetical protein
VFSSKQNRNFNFRFFVHRKTIMMNIGPNELYEMRTDVLVQSHEKYKAKHLEAVQEQLSTMTVDMHIRLIRDIIATHAGAKRFCIVYDLPFDHSNPQHMEILKDLRTHFTERDINFQINESEYNSNIIDNLKPGEGPENFIGKLNYNEFSYLRFKVKTRQMEGYDEPYTYYDCDFVITSQELMHYYILFSTYIRVILYDVQIPITSICNHNVFFGKNEQQHSRMKYYPAVHIPM